MLCVWLFAVHFVLYVGSSFICYKEPMNMTRPCVELPCSSISVEFSYFVLCLFQGRILNCHAV